MSGVHFTSDLHLGHQLVAGLRGFQSTDDHDEAIADNWAKVVKEHDTVWVLGDLSCTGSAIRLEQIINRIATWPGVKHLIAGNHDPIHSMHRDAHKWHWLYSRAFASVQTVARRRIAGHSVLLSHFPYGSLDHTEAARYTQYRLPDLGEYLIHGHTHSDQRVQGPRMVHVGVDAWDLTPVDLRLVAEHLVPA